MTQTQRRKVGRIIVIVVGAIFIATVALTGLGLCGVGGLYVWIMRDNCPHGATIADLRVERVERVGDGIEVRITGDRLQGLPDAYLASMSTAQTQADLPVSVRIEPTANTIVVELPQRVAAGTTRDVAITLSFGCRREALDCHHPGTGDSHDTSLRFTVVAEDGAVAVSTFEASSSYYPGYL